MITRTLIVIAIITVPYLLGMIQTVEIFNHIPSYPRGILYVCFLLLVLLVINVIYQFIRYGEL